MTYQERLRIEWLRRVQIEDQREADFLEGYRSDCRMCGEPIAVPHIFDGWCRDCFQAKWGG